MALYTPTMNRRTLRSGMPILVILALAIITALFITLVRQAQAVPLSILPTNITPKVVTDSDTSAVELGMKFRSSIATTVTGVKFYKGPQNTGTHTGSLWSKSGTRLATVTFKNETASGWQTAYFTTPVNIAANTTYVISYFAPKGRYSSTTNYFSTARTNDTLTALANGTDGGNGVYKYASKSSFPNQTYQASNYWVDVITEKPDTTAPTVAITAPTANQTIGGTVELAANASDDTAVASVQFAINGVPLGDLDTTAPYTAEWDTTIVENGTYTITATAKDTAGNTTTSTPVSITVYNTPPVQPPTAATVSLWSEDATPSTPAVNDPDAVELGVKFRSSADTVVKGVKFYKGQGNTGTHTGNLWTTDGARLATVTFTDETATGWQTAYFDEPVAITANTTYVASYYAPKGMYAANNDYFANNARTNGILTALANGTDGGNGVYRYGSASAFPSDTYQSSNYWVDVIVEDRDVDTTPPTTPPVTPPTNTQSCDSTERVTVTELNQSEYPAYPVDTKVYVPGGVDPWGGCFPGPNNTGVPVGTELTEYTGPCTITEPNTVIDGKIINCWLDIRAKNVTIRNSHVNGRVHIDSDRCNTASFTITDSTVVTDSLITRALMYCSYTAERVNLSGGGSMAMCSNCTIRDSYLHSPMEDPEGKAHNSTVRIGANATIEHNTLYCNVKSYAATDGSGETSGCSANQTGYSHDGLPPYNSTLKRNFYVATNGGYCAYGGSTGAPGADQVHDVKFIENVFQRGKDAAWQWSPTAYICGGYGPITSLDLSRPGNEFTGNTWDNGKPVTTEQTDWAANPSNPDADPCGSQPECTWNPEPATPPVTPTGCVGEPNTPGGSDPWGGRWAGAQNTGSPHGLPGDTRTPVTLTNYTGPTTIRSCGVVIDSKIVSSDIIIEAGNGTHSKETPCVTIRNSLVKGVIFAEQSNHGPVLVEDTEVHPQGLSWWENIGRNNMYVYRVNSHGSEGVIKCDNYCEAKDNWVHGMELGGEYHYNAFGGNGTGDFVIEHNYATCGDWETISNPGSDAGCSAVIGFYGDFGPIERVTIHRNYLESAFDIGPSGDYRQAGYCINPGYYPGKPYPAPSNMIITENIFGRGQTGKCGIFGPSNSLNAIGAPRGNVWSGNRYTDGTAIDRVEE